MTAKEYLCGAKDLDRQIKADLCELSLLRKMIGAVSAIDYARDRVQVSPENSLEKSVVKLISLEEKINQQVDRFVDTKNEIKSKISFLKNRDEKLVLQYRYLCFMSLEMIAVEMNYSYRQIKRIHHRAIVSFERCPLMSL
ncbi:MAG: DUF1492 domain-containing protein [Lachnospiraceae bacterium]|nr:DUF1492 domain-containing protein [Lachnospiraceae bacterium]